MTNPYDLNARLTPEQRTQASKHANTAMQRGLRRKFCRELMREIMDQHAANPDLAVSDLVYAFAQEILRDVE